MVSSRPFQLLIVEDDVVDRKLLERLLAQSSAAPFDVASTDRLDRALEMLQDRAFDVVLLDLGLPDSQGMDSVTRLQARAPETPIIVLSGLDDENTATEAVQQGVQDYLIKGQVDANILVRSIRYALERKKAERQLQAAERRYRTIFENSAVAIMLVDEQDQLVSWNKFTERLLHMEERQLHGRHVRTLHPDSEWRKINALCLNRRGMEHHLETKMICGGGDVIDVDVSLSAIQEFDGGITGSIVVVRDVTERKRVEEALRDSEKRMRLIVEASPLPLHLSRIETGEILLANRATADLFGYDREELLGRTTRDLYADVERDRPAVLAKLREQGRVVQRELAMRKSDGTVFPALVSLESIDYEHQLATLAVVYDLTERKRAEEALHHHVLEIERFNRLATARELRVIDLKRQINELSRAAGQSPPYAAIEDDAPSEPEEAGPIREPAILSTEGLRDWGYQLADLLDRDQMQQLMDSYCDAVGIPSAVIDLEGNVFARTRWQRICMDFHRVNTETCARCIESDTVLSGQLQEGEQFSLYQCGNGLTDAASPIIINGRHVANVFIGQFLLEPPDTDFFRRQAAAFGFDERAYMAALADVPIVPREKLPPILKYLTTCAQLLAEIGLDRIVSKVHEADLVRWADELNGANEALRRQREAALSLAEDANEARTTAERVQESLRESEERLRSMTTAALDAIVMMDEQGRISFWNKAAETMFGYSQEQACDKDLHSLLVPGRNGSFCTADVQKFQDVGQSPFLGKTLELTAIRRNGEEFAVELSLAPVRVHGRCEAVGIIRDISDRKRVEEALLVKNSAVDSAASGIVFIDLDGMLSFVNPSALRMWGYEREDEILGKPFTVFVKSADEGQAAYRSAMEAGVWNGELLARRKDDSDFVAQVVASVVKGKNAKPICLMVSLVDITENRRIHEILDHKQRNLEVIFDAAPMGLLLVDDRLRVARANDAIRQISGKGYADIIDCDACQSLGCARCPDSMDEEDEPQCCGSCSLRSMIRTVLRSGESLPGVEIQPPLHFGGERARLWMAATAAPVTIDGIKHALVALNDITDRKRAEEELKETMEIKAQFISTVSHELRTPLTSMKEAVIIVQEGVAGRINKDQKHFLDIAKRNTDRLARLINDVLDFQKLDGGKMKFTMAPNDIIAVVMEVYSTMRAHAAKSGVDLVTDLQTNLPIVTFDSDRIIQAIMNLVNNGIKFTPEGGQVRVSVRRRQQHVIIAVSDTGYGIPKEDMAKIFDRFYRVQRPGKEIKGTGLGLAIVSKIVTGHGGRIEVESEPEKGATFTMYLPIDPTRGSDQTSYSSDRTLENVLTAK